MDKNGIIKTMKTDNSGYLCTSASQPSNILEILNNQRHSQDQHLCDLVLLVEGQKTLAHKCILAAYSGFIRHHLLLPSGRKISQGQRENATAENGQQDENVSKSNDFLTRQSSYRKTNYCREFATTNILPLPGIKLKYFNHVLEFMYTSSITIDRNNVFPLQLIACFLQINELEETCSAILSKEPKWNLSKNLLTFRPRPILKSNTHRLMSNQEMVSRNRPVPQQTKYRFPSYEIQGSRSMEMAVEDRVESYTRTSDLGSKVDLNSTNHCEEANLTNTPPRNDVFHKTDQEFLPQGVNNNRKFKSSIESPKTAHLWNDWHRKRFLTTDLYVTNQCDVKKHKRSDITSMPEEAFQNKTTTRNNTTMYNQARWMHFPYHNTPTTLYMPPGPLFVNDMFPIPILPQWPHLIEKMPSMPLDYSVPHPGGHNLFSRTVSPTQKYDVSSIKHPRKRKLLSAAFADSETDSVGASSVETCGEPLRANSIEDFHKRGDCDETTKITCLPIPSNRLGLFLPGISNDVSGKTRQTVR